MKKSVYNTPIQMKRSESAKPECAEQEAYSSPEGGFFLCTDVAPAYQHICLTDNIRLRRLLTSLFFEYQKSLLNKLIFKIFYYDDIFCISLQNHNPLPVPHDFYLF